MADLSNSKIKDTYQFLLQADGSGNLQTGLGANPNPIIIRGNLTYVDGNQRSGYVLKSNADGDASWGDASVGDLYISAATLDNTILKLETTSGSTILVPVSYWSSDGLGNYANSGLTGNVGIGIETPNEKLTVLGAISATTDLYLGSTTYTASTITAQEELIIKGRGSDNDFIRLKQDQISFMLDGGAVANFTAPTHSGAFQGFDFNASLGDLGFQINGENSTIFNVTASEDRIRIKDHLTIGNNNAVSHADAVNWGLAVTGSSLFYSGGTQGANKNAIEVVGDANIEGKLTVVGDINGTTDLYLGSATHTASTITAEDTLTIKGNGTNDYLYLANDRLDMYMNGGQIVEMTPTAISFNANAQAVDFSVYSEDNTALIRTRAEKNIVRLLRHVSINQPTGWNWTNEQQQALAVSGTSLFYSGGTYGANKNAIEVVGDANIEGKLTVVGAMSGTTDLYIDDNIRGLRGQFGNSPVVAGPIRDVDIRGEGSVYLRLESTTNANQVIEFMNDREPDFLIYNKFANGGLHIASDDKSFLIIGANDGDAIDLYGNTTISGSTVVTGDMYISGRTTFNGDAVATGGQFKGNLVGNASTVTNGAYTTDNLSVFAATTSAQLKGVLSDETGTGSAVFATGPTLVTPKLGTPTSGVLTNATGYPGDGSLVSTGIVTSGTWASRREFAISALGPGDGIGDVVKFGETDTNAGAIYYYNTSSQWTLTNADAIGTSTGLLAVALGENATEDGMLIKGMVTLVSDPGNVSQPIYLSETDGEGTTTAPTTSGAVVRVIGYSMATGSNQILFNPDNTWVELS